MRFSIYLAWIGFCVQLSQKYFRGPELHYFEDACSLHTRFEVYENFNSHALKCHKSHT